jgi:hypothetical protein
MLTWQYACSTLKIGVTLQTAATQTVANHGPRDACANCSEEEQNHREEAQTPQLPQAAGERGDGDGDNGSGNTD